MRPQRERLERELMGKLRSAEEAYHAAVADHERIRDLYRDMLAHPDGSLALHKAALEERVAVQTYTAALKTFNDFVIFGRLPESNLE